MEFYQTLQLLDVVFSILKITNNSVVATLPQIGSRLFITYVVFPLVPAPAQGSQNTLASLGVFTCIVMWSVTEVIRFSLYTLKTFGEKFDDLARIIGHARYNLFIFAYPLGVTGELMSIFYAYQTLS